VSNSLLQAALSRRPRFFRVAGLVIPRPKHRLGFWPQRIATAAVIVDWLVYYLAYRVLVYRVHGFVVSKLSSHLSKQYSNIDYKSRNAIIAEYSGLELRRPSNTNFRYGLTNPIPAIDSLTLYKGLAC